MIAGMGISGNLRAAFDSIAGHLMADGSEESGSSG